MVAKRSNRSAKKGIQVGEQGPVLQERACVAL